MRLKALRAQPILSILKHKNDQKQKNTDFRRRAYRRA